MSSSAGGVGKSSPGFPGPRLANCGPPPPPPPLEPALDTDLATLGEVLRAVLALLPPDGDVEVVRLLGPFAGRLVLAARVHGEPERADRHPGRRMPQQIGR